MRIVNDNEDFNSPQKASPMNYVVGVIIALAIVLMFKNVIYPGNKESNSDSGQNTEISNAAKELGTRYNPLPVGETGSFDGYTWYKYATEVTVTEVIRGEEANAMVYEASFWNDEPGEGEEYILVKVKIKAIDTKGEGSASVSNYNFDFVKEDGSTYEHDIISGLKPELSDVYQGGTTEGYIGCLIKEGSHPLLSYQDGNLWFSLEETASPD